MNATCQMIQAIEDAMKKHGVPIPNVRVKDGKVEVIDRAPKHAKIAKRNKTSRQVAKWTKASQRTKGAQKP